MRAKSLHDAFLNHFDVVGIIRTKRYLEEAKKMNKKVPNETYPTMVVLGLAYPKRIIKHTNTHLTASFYTYGSDYHEVLKRRIKRVMDELQLSYTMGVDNHPHDERLAAVLAHLGYYAKNQLIINQTYGSYIFLGVVFIDVVLDEEIIMTIGDDCGTCRKCIDACPTKALDEGFYDVKQCISFFNQSKHILTENESKANYTLFGCDICQMVCPKNIGKGLKTHQEFELNGKEMVSIMDLFTDSEKVFREKYRDMAYLWKGKTILMRNALTLLVKHQNTDYNELIALSIKKNVAPWYHETALSHLDKLKKIKNP